MAVSYLPVGWQDAPDHKTTPVNAANLTHMEQGIQYGVDAYNGVDAINEKISDGTYAVAELSWVANADSSTSTDYPYVNEIGTTDFSNNSKPIWDLNGAGTIPTAAERAEINKILEAVFSSSGIKLYATDLPTVDLVLRVKGK